MTIMSRCVLCGGENEGDLSLCLHHTVGDLDWSTVNRLFCDFLHRGVQPPHPVLSERIEEEPWVVLDVDVDNQAMAIV